MLTKIILLAFAMLIAVFLAVLGAITLAFGAVRKSKRRKLLGGLSLLLALLISLESVCYVALKVRARASRVTWAGTVSKVQDVCTYVEPTSPAQAFQKAFGKTLPADIGDLEGVEVTSLMFTQYYFRYHADRDFVLSLIVSVPCVESLGVASDSECKPENDWQWIKERFSPRSPELAQMPYWRPSEVNDAEYYRCIRFPWNHTVMFDKSSDLVYHVIESIWD